MTLLIFLTLLGVPLIEIGVFIEVGGYIGLWMTLVLIVATALAGTALLRHQGMATLARARAGLARGRVPVREVADGFCLLVAGALLLTPGFVTDAAGVLLLIPPARRLILHWVLRRMMAAGRITTSLQDRAARGSGVDGSVIEGEYTELHDDDASAPSRDWGKQR